MTQERLAHYTIMEKIGEGGMGVVFRAGDSKLGRDVALKVLPDIFVQDAERLARFRREAQVLASLNHPNIAAIYGLESDASRHALVLELVGGKTLEERIQSGALPLQEALAIAKQVAEALEAAHERGIVHRDLKPANVKLTPEGLVKVLDFGLAKALETEPSTPAGATALTQSPTITGHMTGANVILGTAAFMSPEQARGQAVDRRVDIWAWGVMLFEMLIGSRLFTGDTVSDTLASVLKTEPGWSQLPDDVPLPIRRLLRRCLRRNPRERLRDIGDARIVIEEVERGEYEEAPVAAEVPVPPSRRRGALAGFALGMVILAAVAAGGAWMLKPTAEPWPLRKLEIPVDDVSPSMFGGTTQAISPDGQRVIYSSDQKLWIRDLQHLEARQLPGTQDAIQPIWSPDGEWVAFFQGTKLMKTPVNGGEPTVVCDMKDAASDAGGGTWLEDGRIVFTTGDSGILEVSAQGGDAKEVLAPNEEIKEDDFHDLSALPRGRGFLFVVHDSAGFNTIAAFDGRERRDVLVVPGQRISDPVYSPTGHVLFQRDPGTPGVWAMPLSLASLARTGDPFLVMPGAGIPSVSEDGTLVLVQGPSTSNTQLVLYDRSGRMERTLGGEHGIYPSPRFSSDGRFVAAQIREADNPDIWLTDVTRGTRTRLTFTDGSDNYPDWSPDGSRIYFMRGSGASEFRVWMQPTDGSGEATEVAPGGYHSISPDGRYLATSHYGSDGWDIYAYALDEEGVRQGEAIKVVEAAETQYWPQVAPNGEYLAYTSVESGRSEIYVTRFPSGRGKWQVSVEGGEWARWSRDGSEILFTFRNSIFAVVVEYEPSFRLGAPQLLFEHPPSGFARPFSWPDGFDVTADGEQFVLVQGVESEGTTQVRPGLVVIQNWAAEFAR